MASEAELGRLCCNATSGKLCHNATSGKLVFKSQADLITVRIPWTPQSYTCQTYSKYHTITFSCLGSFTTGSGTIVSTVAGGTETVIKLRVASGPAVFQLRLSTSTGCLATSEDPGVTCRVLASQRGITPKAVSGISVPRTDSGVSPGYVNVSFDADGKLTGIS